MYRGFLNDDDKRKGFQKFIWVHPNDAKWAAGYCLDIKTKPNTTSPILFLEIRKPKFHTAVTIVM